MRNSTKSLTSIFLAFGIIITAVLVAANMPGEEGQAQFLFRDRDNQAERDAEREQEQNQEWMEQRETEQEWREEQQTQDPNQQQRQDQNQGTIWGVERQTNTEPLAVAIVPLTSEQTAVDTNASGMAMLSLDGETLKYMVAVDNVNGEITSAEIRRSDLETNNTTENEGGLFGDTGDEAVVHSISFDGRVAQGSVDLSEEEVQAMQLGNLYIDVKTDQYPEGEIRGQLNAAESMEQKERQKEQQMNQ
jgi:hypothetical protein